jgi:hypothetical protein
LASALNIRKEQRAKDDRTGYTTRFPLLRAIRQVCVQHVSPGMTLDEGLLIRYDKHMFVAKFTSPQTATDVSAHSQGLTDAVEMSVSRMHLRKLLDIAFLEDT